MCCNCGGSFPKSKTILVKRGQFKGLELCYRCSEDMGVEEEQKGGE